MITQALVVAEPGAAFEYQDVELDDDLQDVEVLVRVHATGLCHTDLNFSKEKSMPGLFPAVFGHEGAGVVERVGSEVFSVKAGDRVLMTYACCGECKYCRAHDTSYCKNWFGYNFSPGRLDGTKAFRSKEGGERITSHFFGQSTFARHAIVMEKGLVRIPGDLPFSTLCPLGCGILTGAGAMLNVVQPSASSAVAIIGTGSVGLAALMALKLLPSPPQQIIAVDVVEERLQVAKRYGATHTINTKVHPELTAALMALTQGEGVDGTIDTTGRPDVISSLMNATAKKGKVVSVGVGQITARASASIFDTVNSGRTYVGCCMGSGYPQVFIPMLIRAWTEGKFPFDELIKTYAATDVKSAISDVLSGETIKAVITWD